VLGGDGCFLTSGKDSVVIPRAFVVFERSIKRGEFSINDEVGHDVFFPISGAGIHPLGSKIAKVDSVLVMNTVRW
jgi:hypothetical protein